MRIIIRGEKIEVTEAMKSYAEEKLDKLDKYFENNEEIEGKIIAKLDGHNQKVEITIPIKNITLRVEETGEDFYATIDTALDKLERQIRKNKTRIESRKRSKEPDYMYFNFSDVIEDEQEEKQIVKRKKLELIPMDEEEAMLQMELLNHDFYMFKNRETNKISIIYKRKDNNYGILEQE